MKGSCQEKPQHFLSNKKQCHNQHQPVLYPSANGRGRGRATVGLTHRAGLTGSVIPPLEALLSQGDQSTLEWLLSQGGGGTD